MIESGRLRHSVHNLEIDTRRLVGMFSRRDRDAVSSVCLKGTGNIVVILSRVA